MRITTEEMESETPKGEMSDFKIFGWLATVTDLFTISSVSATVDHHSTC